MHLFCSYLVILCLHLFANLHGDHISVTNIDYISDTNSLNIAIKLNTDDLDYALAHGYKTSDLPGCKIITPETNKMVIKYINTTFKINANKNYIELKFKRREISGLDTWVYFTASISKKAKEMEIMQAQFFDIYTDQVNLIIFSKNNIPKGYKTTFYERTININLKGTK